MVASVKLEIFPDSAMILIKRAQATCTTKYFSNDSGAHRKTGRFLKGKEAKLLQLS